MRAFLFADARLVALVFAVALVAANAALDECAHPGWCTHEGAKNTYRVCGGVPGNFCEDDQGSTGFAPCDNKEAHTWPHGTCAEAAEPKCADDKTWNEGACARFAAYELKTPGTLGRFCKDGRPELLHCRQTCGLCDGAKAETAVAAADEPLPLGSTAPGCEDNAAWGEHHKCSDLAEYLAIKPDSRAKFCAVSREERTHCRKTCHACPSAVAATTSAPQKTCAQIFDVGAVEFRPLRAMCFARLELFLEEHHCYDYGGTHIVDACKPRSTTGACVCAKTYAPVKCSNGQTYANQCAANCDYASGCVAITTAQSLDDSRAELHTLFVHNQQIANENAVLNTNVTALLAQRTAHVAQLTAERERAGALLAERDSLSAKLVSETRANVGLVSQVEDLASLLQAAKAKVANLETALQEQAAAATAANTAAAKDASALQQSCADDLALYRTRSTELGAALNRTQAQLTVASANADDAEADVSTLRTEVAALHGEVATLTGSMRVTNTTSAARIAVLTAWNAKISDDQQQCLQKHSACALDLSKCASSSAEDAAMRASDAADMQSDLDEITALRASCEARFTNTSTALNAALTARIALQSSLAHETAALAAKSEALAASVARATTLDAQLKLVSEAKAHCAASEASYKSSLETKSADYTTCSAELTAVAASKLVLQNDVLQCQRDAAGAASEATAIKTQFENRVSTLLTTLRVTNGTLLLEKAALASENEALSQEKAECGVQFAASSKRKSQLQGDYVAAVAKHTTAQAQWETLRFDLDKKVNDLTAAIESTDSASSLAKTLCDQMNASHTAHTARLSASLEATTALLDASNAKVRDLSTAATVAAVRKVTLEAKLDQTVSAAAATATRLNLAIDDATARAETCDETYTALSKVHRTTVLHKTALDGQLAVANATLADSRELLRVTQATLTGRDVQIAADAASIASLGSQLSTATARADLEAAGSTSCHTSLQSAIAEFSSHKSASNTSLTTCTSTLVEAQAAASRVSAELTEKARQATVCATKLTAEMTLHLSTKNTMSTRFDSLRKEAQVTNASHAQCVQNLAVKTDEAAACTADATREGQATAVCIGQKSTLQTQLTAVSAQLTTVQGSVDTCAAEKAVCFSQKATVEQQVASIGAVHNTTKATLADEQGKKAACRTELAQQDAKLNACTDKITLQETAKATCLGQKSTLQARLSAANAKLTSTGSQHTAAQDSADSCAAEKAVCLGEKAVCLSQKATVEQQVASIGAVHNTTKATLADEQGKKAACRTELAQQDAKLNACTDERIKCATDHANANATSIAVASQATALRIQKAGLAAEVAELRANVAVSAAALEVKGDEARSCAADKVVCLSQKATVEQQAASTSAAHNMTKAALAGEQEEKVACRTKLAQLGAVSAGTNATINALGLEKAALAVEVTRLTREVSAANSAQVAQVGALGIEKDALAAEKDVLQITLTKMTADLAALKLAFDVDGDGKVGPVDTTAIFIVVNVPQAYGGVQMLAGYFQKLDTAPVTTASAAYASVRKGIAAVRLVTVSDALLGVSDRR